jgi:hypothetical protein
MVPVCQMDALVMKGIQEHSQAPQAALSTLARALLQPALLIPTARACQLDALATLALRAQCRQPPVALSFPVHARRCPARPMLMVALSLWAVRAILVTLAL